MAVTSTLGENVTCLNSSSVLNYQHTSTEHWVFDIEALSAIYYVKVIVVSVVSVFIVLSNLLNIHILLRNSHVPKISRIFLLNLSTSDLSVGLISCIPTIYSSIIGYWPYGSVWCQIAGIFHGASCTISIWSISMVSIERYFAICKPVVYSYWRSTRKAYVVIACLWTLALVTFISPSMSKPDFLYYQYSTDENICGLHWQYKWFCVVTSVFIPILSGCVLVFTNVKIMRKIVTRHKEFEQINSRIWIDRKGLNAVKLLISTSTMFFLAWGPYVTLVLLESFTETVTIPGNVKFALMWLANSNSFMNVITFSVVYKSFRDEIKHLFVKRLCCCRLARQDSETGNNGHVHSTSDCFHDFQNIRTRNAIEDVTIRGRTISIALSSYVTLSRN